MNAPHSGGEVTKQRFKDAGSGEVAQLWRLVLLEIVAFVVYGSSVPLNSQPMAWDEAVVPLMDFAAVELSSGSRIDKASNLLLTVPVPVAFAAAQNVLLGRSTVVAVLKFP